MVVFHVMARLAFHQVDDELRQAALCACKREPNGMSVYQLIEKHTLATSVLHTETKKNLAASVVHTLTKNKKDSGWKCSIYTVHTLTVSQIFSTGSDKRN
jgi:hypothetical protein